MGGVQPRNHTKVSRGGERRLGQPTPAKARVIYGRPLSFRRRGAATKSTFHAHTHTHKKNSRVRHRLIVLLGWATRTPSPDSSGSVITYRCRSPQCLTKLYHSGQYCENALLSGRCMGGGGVGVGYGSEAGKNKTVVNLRANLPLFPQNPG